MSKLKPKKWLIPNAPQITFSVKTRIQSCYNSVWCGCTNLPSHNHTFCRISPLHTLLTDLLSSGEQAFLGPEYSWGIRSLLCAVRPNGGMKLSGWYSKKRHRARSMYWLQGCRSHAAKTRPELRPLPPKRPQEQRACLHKTPKTCSFNTEPWCTPSLRMYSTGSLRGSHTCTLKQMLHLWKTCPLAIQHSTICGSFSHHLPPDSQSLGPKPTGKFAVMVSNRAPGDLHFGK